MAPARSVEFPSPGIWHGLFSAASGADVEPPIFTEGRSDDGVYDRYSARVNPYERYHFGVSSEHIFVVRLMGRDQIGIWEVEDPPILPNLIDYFVIEKLVDFRQLVVPKTSLIFHPTAEQPTDRVRKERVVLCENKIVIVVFSEVEPPVAGQGELVNYSMGLYPVVEWWNFQFRALEVGVNVERVPVCESLPTVQGTGGLSF